MSANTDRVLDILVFLVDHPQGTSLRELAEATGTTRATAYRTVDTLVRTGWVISDGQNPARLTASLRVMQLGLQMLRHHRVRDLILPSAIALARDVKCTCMLAFYERGDVVYTDAIEWFAERVTTSPSGVRTAAYTTGSGTVLLAMQDENEIARALEELSNSVSSSPIPPIDEIRAQLELTRTRGYGISNRTYRPSASGIGVPVFDRRSQAIAAFGIHSDSPVDDEFLARVLPRALDHAKQASRDLGFRSTSGRAMA